MAKKKKGSLRKGKTVPPSKSRGPGPSGETSPSEGNAPPPSPAAPKTPLFPSDENILERVDELRNLFLVRRTAEAADLVDLLRSKRRLMLSNFLLGLARGVGFFLGVTIVGGLLLGAVALAFGWVDKAMNAESGTAERFFQRMIDKGEKLKGEVQENGGSDEERLRALIKKMIDDEKGGKSGKSEPRSNPSSEAGGEKPPPSSPRDK